MPAVRGGWRRSMPAEQRLYLPLTPQVLTEHLSGVAAIGLYPMLDGDRVTGWRPISTATRRCSTPLPMSRLPERVGAVRCVGDVAVGVGAHTRGCSSPPRSRPDRPRRSAPGCCARRCARRPDEPDAATTGCSPSQDVLPPAGRATSSPRRCRAMPNAVAPPCSSISPRWNRTRTNGPTYPPWTG